MASIYEKDGYYYLQYSEKLGGKRYRRQVATGLSVSPINEKKALFLKEEIEYKLNAPKEILSYYYPLKTAFNDFLNARKQLHPTTIDMYKVVFNRFTEAVGVIMCSEVREEHVDKFIESLADVSSNTKATYFNHLKAFFEFLKDKRYITHNFIFKFKATPRPVSIIPDDLFQEIISRCRTANQKFFLRFLWFTGFRIEEAIHMKWLDINWEQSIIYIRNNKDKCVNEFPLYNDLKRLLNENKGTGKLFDYSSRHGLKFWTRIKTQMNHPYTLHDIRSTFAFRLFNKNIPVEEASQLLRH
ncbi:MAG: tyrosine-type recombinase/integrase, partial [Ignavibacteriales bacterium]|nr:tyrosine-type recombinase/integrase [Ignavibacteriales bacterium]